jgi:hypothetical protein
VAFVAGASAFRAAAQIPDESAGATLENVLKNVIVTSPREATRVI